MFAYCGNDPANCSDSSGCRPSWEHSYGNGLCEYTDAGTGAPDDVLVFYNADQNWENAAYKTGQDLCLASGGSRYGVIPAETKRFLSAWGKIRAPIVLIEVHGSPTSLVAPDSLHINIRDVQMLMRNKKIKCVIITACSSGKETPGQLSIAREISTKIDPSGIVICATRDVTGDGSKFWFKEYGAWIIYQNGSFLPARLHAILTMKYASEWVS